MARISVVMSIYKESVEWIIKAIDSVLKQTFSDFEFLIVNDCPDRAENNYLLSQYKQNDSRIVVINNEENLGLTKSLNKALLSAKGEYIVRMDADDISLPNRIECQLSFMDKNKNIVASGCSVSIIDGEGKRIGTMRHATDPVELRSISIFESPIFHPTAIIRRVIDGHPFFYDEHFKQAQDYALWSKLIVNHDVSNIDKFLLNYRITNQNISHQNRKGQSQYAIEIQNSLYNNLNVHLSDYDKDVLSSIFKNDSLRYSNEDIINATVRLKKNNRNLRDVRINKTIDYVILLFCNYLPSYYKMGESLKCFVKVVIKTRQFRIYNLLSLLNKYRLIGFL